MPSSHLGDQSRTLAELILQTLAIWTRFVDLGRLVYTYRWFCERNRFDYPEDCTSVCTELPSGRSLVLKGKRLEIEGSFGRIEVISLSLLHLVNVFLLWIVTFRN